MRIEINKNQQENNFQDHVNSVIRIAKKTADSGLSEFEYYKPEDTGRSFGKLIDAVEKITEGTVVQNQNVDWTKHEWAKEEIHFKIK